jgi:DNA repair exonuclease SbcCD nuclease subunit
MLRIVHLADAHIGQPYTSPKFRNCRSALRRARIEALERAVELANERRAHFLVVAGDLFDRIAVDDADIGAVAAALAGFKGDAALVVPGNHDHVSPGDEPNDLWRRLRRGLEELEAGSPEQRAGAERVHLLLEAVQLDLEADGTRVRFYPCPCTSKTSESHAIGWVRDAERLPGGGLHVGIAHGNLEGLALDREGRYFHMTQAELEDAGVDLWLLGHVHRPWPATGGTARHRIFMSGTTAPEDVKSNHRGTAWLLEIEGGVVRRHEQLVTGRLDFRRVALALHPDTGLAEVERALGDGTPNERVLELVLTGELTPEQHDALAELVRRVEAEGRFLFLSCSRDEVARRLPASDIVAQAPEGTATRRFLEALARSENPADLYIAHELNGANG